MFLYERYIVIYYCKPNWQIKIVLKVSVSKTLLICRLNRKQLLAHFTKNKDKKLLDIFNFLFLCFNCDNLKVLHEFSEKDG